MANPRTYEEFVTFMVEYTAFLGRMKADENSKLAALSSRDLSRIEHSIMVSQANAKQLENYEIKRQTLQAAAGFTGLTFRQLIDQAPLDEHDRLWQLFDCFENNVAQIRFYNDKSMAIARDNMIEIDPSSVLPGQPGAKANNPYEKIKQKQNESSKILETKV